MSASLIGRDGATIATDANPVPAGLPVAANSAGYAGLAVLDDSGVLSGTKTFMALQASDGGVLHVGQFTRVQSSVFPGTSIDSTVWQSPVGGTATVTVASGQCVLSTVATTSGNVARVSSYRLFSLDLGYHTEFEMLCQFAVAPQANNVTEWGVGIVTGVTAPSDGAFFRMTATGEFRCVVSFNGVETTTAALNFNTMVGLNTNKEFYIKVSDQEVAFWIADDQIGAVPLAAGGATMTASQSLPLFVRTYNTGVPAAVQVVKFSGFQCALGSTDTSKPWSHIMVSGGGHASQGQTGQTLGTIAQYANSANPTAAVPTNTTAALATGLGGQFWETDTLAVNTDGIVMSYQVPVGTAQVPGKMLNVSKINISSFVQTAITGGPYVGQFTLAYGHNTVSLASAESSSAGTKAPRRMVLGIQPVATNASVSIQVGNTIDLNFEPPIVVYAGEFIQIVKKKIGIAPTAGVIAHCISIGGYWE